MRWPTGEFGERPSSIGAWRLARARGSTRALTTRRGIVIAMCLSLAFGAAAACDQRQPGGNRGRDAGASASPPADPAARAAALVATLTDEDLVGQVLMPYIYGTDATSVSQASRSANQEYAKVSTPAEMISRYRLGGVILMSRQSDDPTAATTSTSNIQSPSQVRDLTTGLRAAAGESPAKVPPLIGIDQEFGTVTRIRDGVVQLPSALALGAGHDASVTERAWNAAGEELAALGVNVDFAPDADVLGGAAGGVIGSRSFGSDPSAVGAQVAAAVKGLSSAGVAATLKHFPGHGHTIADSHTDLPVLSQDLAAIETGDLPPFAAGMAAGAPLVMSGHLDVKAIDPGVPASFSSKILIDLLRGKLRFGGVVVTDALNMAPAKRWSPGDAAVKAIVAGNDLLLMPPNLAAAHAGLLAGVRSGALPKARLVEAVTRVLTLKFRLADVRRPEMSVVGGEEHQRRAGAAAAAAVTMLRGPCGGAVVTGPIRVTTSGGRNQQRDWLREALRSRGATVVDSGGARVHLVGYGDAREDLADDASVTVAMDTPYSLASATSPYLLATYSSTKASMEALASVLLGKAGAPGRSPVEVPGLPRSTCQG